MGTAGKAGSFIQGFMDAFNAERDRRTRKKESEQGQLINKQMMELRQQQSEFQAWQQQRAIEKQAQEEQTSRGLMKAYGDKVPGLDRSLYGWISPDEAGSEQVFTPPDLQTVRALIEDYTRGEEVAATRELRTQQAEAAKASAEASRASAEATTARVGLESEKQRYVEEVNKATSQAIVTLIDSRFPGLRKFIGENVEDLDKINAAGAATLANMLVAESQQQAQQEQDIQSRIDELDALSMNLQTKLLAMTVDSTTSKTQRAHLEANMMRLLEGVEKSKAAFEAKMAQLPINFQQRFGANPQAGGNMSTPPPQVQQGPAGAMEDFYTASNVGGVGGMMSPPLQDDESPWQ